ncbi:MAG: tetratricopeptide repeat protein, partial [Pseudomonadota bacterium]
ALSSAHRGGGAGSLIETGDTAPGARTIDPSYAVAPETRRAPPSSEEATLLQRAAELAMAEGQHYGAVAHLSRLSKQRPDDKRVAYDLARHLRYIGALSDAERVLNDARARHPEDPLLQLELAKAKIAGGFAEEALILLSALRTRISDDPAILQAVGVANDRLGRHAAAQEAYADAIALGRPSAPLLNNDGLSRLLSGDIDGAVRSLRRASTAPGASAQVRQNLALALVLRGDDEEARRVAKGSLPEDLAKQMLEKYRSIAVAQDAWSLAQE